MFPHKMIDGATDNENSDSIQVPAGEHLLMAAGTFGSGTVAAEYSPDGGTTWVSVATLTATGSAAFKIPAGRIRHTLSGATSPEINSWTAAIGGQDA